MKKIEDFGQKIGGAKKDIWEIFHSVSAEKQSEMAQKEKLWKRNNSHDLPKEVSFWQNAMRRAVKPRAEKVEAFMKFCLAFKEDVEACKSMDDIKNFYKNQIFGYMVKIDDHHWKYKCRDYAGFFDGNKVLYYVKDTEKRILQDCKAKEVFQITELSEVTVATVKGGLMYKGKCDNCILSFRSQTELAVSGENKLYLVMKGHQRINAYASKAEAEKGLESAQLAEKRKSKARFLPPHLSNIERTGSNYKFFRMADGSVLMSRFGIRGGEFGNWATAKDRLGNINMCYDAFEDLHQCLGISPKDISLGGELAIAFGARGRGTALAHYEPLRNVINITRLHGAGSLAHEWGHAMDMYVGNHYNLHGYMSAANDSQVPQSAKELIHAFHINSDGSETAFLCASKEFDKEYSKSGNGYWASPQEMFARAFACYVQDKLGDRRSDYLVGHAECAKMGNYIAYPVGEERKRINQKFDVFFAEMIKEGLFTAETVKAEQEETVTEFNFFQGDGGQLRFC